MTSAGKTDGATAGAGPFDGGHTAPTATALLDRIRHADTLLNRFDTREGRIADMIDRILARRALERKLHGFTIATSQEIALAILEGDAAPATASAASAMLAALEQASTELEDRMDCDDGIPNWAMRLKTEVDEAIAAAKALSHPTIGGSQ